MQSLKELSLKRYQRTVYRLTLVKGWNAEEMDNYAKLVEIGKPDFIEVKGVTYCGSNSNATKANTLTMENVPWHEEVVGFVKSLAERIQDRGYEIASEHEHSNCVLIANKKFKVDGVWKTWIDYDAFQSLVKNFYESGKEFDTLDYASNTPDWAIFGCKEQGFDPNETRFHRKQKQNQS